MTDAKDARGVSRRQFLAGASAATIAALAGCTEGKSWSVQREIRDEFDVATQHRSYHAQVDAPENVSEGDYINGSVLVENTDNERNRAKVLLEVREVNGSGYRSVADEIVVPANGSETVEWSVYHHGPGEYEVSVAGFADDETVVVEDTNSTRLEAIEFEINNTTTGGSS